MSLGGLKARHGSLGSAALQPSGSRFRPLALALALVPLLYALATTWISTTQNTLTIDFFTFWTVQRSLTTRPPSNIYSVDGQRALAADAVSQAGSPVASDIQRRTMRAVVQLYNGRVDATASPLLYASLGLLSSGNYAADQKRFLFVSMLSLAVSLWILSTLLDLTLLELLLVLLYSFWVYEPVFADIQVGNVNGLQLLPIALFIFLFARSRPLFAGTMIGAASTFKPTTLFVLILAIAIGLVDRQYKQVGRLLLGSGAAAAACVLLSGLYLGDLHLWLQFARSLPNTLNGASYSLDSGNFSLAGLLFGRTGGRSAIIPFALLSILCGLLLTSRSRTPADSLASEDRQRLSLHSAFCAGGCGCALMLLSSPLVWFHYYVLLLPLLLYVICGEPEHWRLPIAQSSPGARFAWSMLRFSPLFGLSLLGHALLGDNAKAVCIVVISASLITLLLALLRIWRNRRCPLATASLAPALDSVPYASR